MSDITYFANSGRENTEQVGLLAARRAQELGIDTVLIASSTGASALKIIPYMAGRQVVVVSRSTGRMRPNVQEMPVEVRRQLESLGARVLTCQHAFGGVNRAIRRKFETYQVDEIIAAALRVFGDGTKVCIEISLMAADAGLVRTDQDVISIAGSSGGSDTALVLQPANAQDFFDLKVKEIICKPRL
ncbi:MAG: hypothetical protein M1343_05670 [Chloroflexi bacterium]|nr:hypothetical protein [Chloroflexota bacterium]MDA8189796.1 hypothetical protein [Dehalococcoidales bacterium]